MAQAAGGVLYFTVRAVIALDAAANIDHVGGRAAP
jgi:hypothetical protein